MYKVAEGLVLAIPPNEFMPLVNNFFHYLSTFVSPCRRILCLTAVLTIFGMLEYTNLSPLIYQRQCAYVTWTDRCTCPKVCRLV